MILEKYSVFGVPVIIDESDVKNGVQKTQNSTSYAAKSPKSALYFASDYIRTWYVYQHFLFDFPFDEIYVRLLFFTLGRSFYA